MKPFLHRIWAGCETAMARAGRERARRQLLRMSDRSLADAGFSRAALESGVAAWPWRHDEDDAAVAAAMHGARARRAAERRAVRELDACSDADLADLGIARADIGRAVREGRIGVEIDPLHEHDGRGQRRAA